MTTYSAASSPVAGGRFIWPEWRRNLTPGVWSANLAANNYVDAVIERKKTDADFGTYYAAPGHPAVTVSSQNPWAYSSGCYVPGRKKYVFTGGGHDDWLGSEVGVFDLLTLTWARTDESAKLAQVQDPSVPFQSDDSLGWRAWRNPSGRFAPISTHTYGGMVYLPSLDAVHVIGGASYRSGMGGAGGAMLIDAATGQWDESGAHAGVPAAVNCASVRIPTVYVVDSTLTPTGQTITDAVFRSTYMSTPSSRLIDPAAKAYYTHTGYWSVAHRGTSHGCVVPDPVYPGRLAYVADCSTTQLAVFHRVDIVKNNGTTVGSIEAINYGNTKPGAIGAGDGTRWIYMGDYIPGSTKIAVLKEGAGIYTLDTDGWIWSDLIITAPLDSIEDAVWKRFEYLPDLGCFGIFTGTQFYALALPSEVF